ncbi:MAG: M20/M25/M40 family metallo-hydrolase [Clostridia bacterium]|nr:M20/M25/M40 family metallo-hydrolase [Clostridia bacterium]
MDLEQFLREVVEQPGLPGNELPVALWLRERFAPHCDTATVDAMQNMIARQSGAANGPKVYVTAHIDEIGLCVIGIEKDGCLRFTQMGGVDPRVLPGGEVRVLTESGPLVGIVGAKPPHLLTEEDRKKNYKREDLFIDLGLPAQDVKARVNIGDRVQLVGPLTKLAGDCVAAKTMDDRACVAIMLLAAERLAGIPHAADIYYVCAAQEEVGSRGALTSCYAIDPDIGIAIDVTHGAMPDCKPDETFPLDKVVFSKGPNLHPKLVDAMLKVAAEHRVETKLDICPSFTGTDAEVVQISRAGVPTALISLPLKYMHTTVETCSTTTLKEAARLLAAYLASLQADWEADWRNALCN